jgi:S-adenosylmethionine:tRNA ribosyltransferase-isomerase
MGYTLKDFRISIPKQLIAQFPSEQRHLSRLLVLDADSGMLRDEVFNNITTLIGSGDCVVFNDARVINARLYGNRVLAGGEKGGRVELLLTQKVDSLAWHCLIRPAKRVREESNIALDCDMTVKVTHRLGDGAFTITFPRNVSYRDLQDMGEIPLPKYIKRKPVKTVDEVRYQTVYAKQYGAVASPTAGLHFTRVLIQRLKRAGTIFVPVTLHVDWGTFKPVRENDYRDHVIHSERYEITANAAELINQSRRDGRRIVCVGTTSVRALESATDERGTVRSRKGETQLYIYPGYTFKSVNAMITNFHMPDSTLILLVAAFAGKEHIEKAYAHAVEKGYRFFSYGDAMFIHRGKL